jgi:HEAT repeat protein
VQRRSEAEKALKAIGAPKAVPYLLEMAKASDGPIRTWLLRQNEKWKLRVLTVQEAVETQQLGIAGFEVLGTNCASAVPELTRLMQDTNHTFTALRCLVGIGKPAEVPVCQALTNQNPEIRRFAAEQLACVTDDIDVYLARLNGPMNDADGIVRFAAVQALGLQTQYPKEIIPLLVKMMADSQQSVSGYAAKFLGDLGINGIEAVEALSNVVENGSAYMSGQALKSLASIAPDRALPLVLTWLHSSDPNRRAQAAWTLGKFPTATPEILAALRHATADSETRVVQNATTSLKEYRDAEQKQQTAEIVIPSEPSYHGRKLGEWLKRKPDDNEISQEARHAIREMGTNAIPALVARLEYKDPRFGLPDDQVTIGAVGGFYALGEKAVPALPRLQELLNSADRRLALFALVACANMGTSSVPMITAALTNQYADVRTQAVGFFWDAPIPSLAGARKSLTPEIAKLLCDPDQAVRMNATNALKQIDPRAAGSAGLR